MGKHTIPLKNAILWDVMHVQFHNSSILAKKTTYMAALLRRPLRLNSTLTIPTKRMCFVSVNHGSLLSAP
jgi:hypothetical protein